MADDIQLTPGEEPQKAPPAGPDKQEDREFGVQDREQRPARDGRGKPQDVVREIVLPGEVLGSGKVRPGPGTYKENGTVFAACLGIKSAKPDMISVIPLSGRYIPRPGDVVVGKVLEMTPSAWVIDLNSPYVAPLPGAETPWEVEFGDTRRFLEPGDTVLVEIRDVSEIGRVSITMNGPSLRKLEGGQTIDVDATKVPRIIGRGGSMIGLLKRLTRCRLLVGQNGRIWLDGTVEDIQVAIEAIRLIEREAHKMGLTDAVAKQIEDMRKDIDGKRGDRELRADALEEYRIIKDRVERDTKEEEE